MPYWLYIFLIILAVYLVISIALYYLQDYLLFKPEKLPEDFQFYYENQDTEEYNHTREQQGVDDLSRLKRCR